MFKLCVLSRWDFNFRIPAPHCRTQRFSTWRLSISALHNYTLKKKKKINHMRHESEQLRLLYFPHGKHSELAQRVQTEQTPRRLTFTTKEMIVLWKANPIYIYHFKINFSNSVFTHISCQNEWCVLPKQTVSNNVRTFTVSERGRGEKVLPPCKVVAAVARTCWILVYLREILMKTNTPGGLD